MIKNEFGEMSTESYSAAAGDVNLRAQGALDKRKNITEKRERENFDKAMF